MIFGTCKLHKATNVIDIVR